MKYSELINFTPIEDIIQLTSSGDANKAREYVKSYVMSDTMVENMQATVIGDGGNSMKYSMEERCRRIIDFCLQETSYDPMEVFGNTAKQDFVRMHGPEHHVLDGACLLTAFHNAGGNLPDLPQALERLMAEGLRMPGAVCGLWGVCGAVMSVGAALAIIDGTGPLSTDGSWGSHMQYTSAALARLAEIGGPRCCKRDAFIALQTAVEYVKERYGVCLNGHPVECAWSPKNAQCLGHRCPYHPSDG